MLLISQMKVNTTRANKSSLFWPHQKAVNLQCCVTSPEQQRQYEKPGSPQSSNTEFLYVSQSIQAMKSIFY